jgi:phosphatidylglycerol---prolipoprotein diacylglyceryl transferase
MHPYILKDIEIPLGFTTIGPFSIGTYGLMMAIGFLWAWRFSRRTCLRRGWDPEFAYTLVINAMISGIIGARLFHVVDHWDYYQHDLSKIFTASSGLTWYGGLILAITTSYIVSRRKGYKFSGGLDMVTPALAAGYAWGRIGCFFAGDGCYGIEVSPPWEFLGLAFPDGLVKAIDPVHPTMLYEALFNFSLFGILFWVDAKWTVPNRWRYGLLFAIFAFFHSLERFLVEFIRINDRYWFDGFSIAKYSSSEYFAGTWGLSFSQWISIGGMAVGIVFFAILIRGKGAPYPIHTGDAWIDQHPAPEPAKPVKKRRKKRK